MVPHLPAAPLLELAALELAALELAALVLVELDPQPATMPANNSASAAADARWRVTKRLGFNCICVSSPCGDTRGIPALFLGRGIIHNAARALIHNAQGWRISRQG